MRGRRAGGRGETAVAGLGSAWAALVSGAAAWGMHGARRLHRLLVFPVLVAAVLLLAGTVAGAGDTAGSGIVSFGVDDPRSPALLSGSDGFNGSPVVSPDGRSVAFISDREPWKAVFNGCDCSDAVYVMQLDGSGVRRVSAPPPASAVPVGWRLSDPAWSPDGRTIYFSAYVVVRDNGDVRSNHSSLWQVSAGGGVPELISDFGGAFALSRDGRYVSVARRFFAGGGELHVISTRSGAVVRLAVANGHNSAVAPAWSPRANFVAFIDAKARHVIIAYPGGRRRWTFAASWVSAIAWSPDGKRIAYTVAGRRPGLWMATLVTRRKHRIVDVPLPDSVSWSPSGDWLLVGGRDSDIFVRPNGRDLHTEGDIVSPRWSPDGRRVAFFTASSPTWLKVVRPASNAAAEPAYLLASAGALCRSYTPATSWFCGLTWTPDGHHILAGFHN